MRLLLDTHALVWFVTGEPSLGAAARMAVDHAFEEGGLLVSAITFWEVALLSAKGRLEIGDPEVWRAQIMKMGVAEVELDGGHAIRSAQIQGAHRDPADRFIMAAAMSADAILVTADRKILDWTGPLARLDARR